MDVPASPTEDRPAMESGTGEVGSAEPAPDEGSAVDDLYAATYRELRQLAHSRLRGGGRNTVLDTTALVHESYLRLNKSKELLFPDRTRFLVYAGRVMRSIIIDLVRQRQTERHGGDMRHVTLTGEVAGAVWALPPTKTRFSVCTRRWSNWRRWTNAWPGWSSCAISVE